MEDLAVAEVVAVVVAMVAESVVVLRVAFDGE